MSVKVQSMVWDADIEHNQKFVLLALADQSNDFGKECWPSIAHLAAKCNLTDRAIQKNLKKLEERGQFPAMLATADQPISRFFFQKYWS